MTNNKIVNAMKEDTAELLALYRTQLYGAAEWSETYPSEETIAFDLSRDALFVMKNEKNEIIAAISIDEDAEVAELPCWSKALEPAGELSRLCVREDMQGQGIARLMMQHAFEELKNRGMKGVHILVKTGHVVALASYAHLDFKKVGECVMFGKDFFCFEREL